jgi:hypothetical protein
MDKNAELAETLRTIKQISAEHTHLHNYKFVLDYEIQTIEDQAKPFRDIHDATLETLLKEQDEKAKNDHTLDSVSKMYQLQALNISSLEASIQQQEDEARRCEGTMSDLYTDLSSLLKEAQMVSARLVFGCFHSRLVFSSSVSVLLLPSFSFSSSRFPCLLTFSSSRFPCLLHHPFSCHRRPCTTTLSAASFARRATLSTPAWRSLPITQATPGARS